MNLDAADKLTSVMFLVLIAWSIIGTATRFLSRKEFYSVSVMVDAVGLIGWFITMFKHEWHFTPWRVISLCLWSFWLRRDIKRYRDSDDDEDHRKRRREWAKSKLPKPVVKPLENPT